MADRSRLAEILGAEEDEEIVSKITRETYRVHSGVLQLKVTSEMWASASAGTLCKLINDPTLVVHKPRFTDEEMTLLRLLHKYGKLNKLYMTKDGYAGITIDGALPIGVNIANRLLTPDEMIDLDEMFKEEENGEAD